MRLPRPKAMAERFTDAEVLKVSDNLFPILCRTDSSMRAANDKLITAIGLDPGDIDSPHSISGENIFLGILKGANGTNKFLDAITYCIDRGYDEEEGDQTRVAAINTILNAHELMLDLSGADSVIKPMGSKAVVKVKKAQESYLASHAPKESLEYLQNALKHYGKAEYEDALTNSRKALENLTLDGKFSEGIDELVSKKVILVGDSSRKTDAELMRAVYGYCSTMGAHGGGKTSPSRARLGVLSAEASVNFLVRRLEWAKKNGITPTKWRKTR